MTSSSPRDRPARPRHGLRHVLSRVLGLPAPLCPGALLWRGLALGWTGMALWGLLSPGVAVPAGFPSVSDLVLHGIVFAGLSGLLLLGWPQRFVRSWGLLLIAPVVLELAQGLVPGRLVEAGDLVANLAGTGLGWFLGSLVLMGVKDSC